MNINNPDKNYVTENGDSWFRALFGFDESYSAVKERISVAPRQRQRKKPFFLCLCLAVAVGRRIRVARD